MSPARHRYGSVIAPRRWPLLLALLAGLLPAVAGCRVVAQSPSTARDRVVLVDGKELRGRVVHEDANEVLLRVGSTDKAIARKLVREVHAVATHHRELLQQWRDSSPEDPAAMLRLADKADEQGLPYEARLFRWYALLQRPDDVELHTALGNKRAGKQWLVALGDKRVPFDRADAMGVDFAAAWRLRSEHFELRCAAGLRVALDTLLELEGQYHAFHASYGDTLRLLELCEPIPVHLYRDRAQMPQQSGAIGAYYKPDEATLFTCCENGRAYALAHEATHALLHHTFGRALRAKGELPAWLDEAWAEHFAGRLQTRVPGKPVLLTHSVQPAHRTTLAHSAANDLLSVQRVLNLQQGDFQASTGQAGKYAQAWALFTFLFEHGDDAIRATFGDYLRQAAAGKGQSSTFRKLFAAHEALLPNAWQ